MTDIPGGRPLGEDHRYRLDERIATGGMGEVWRGTDTVLGRDVAVKVMKSEFADDPLFRSRFEAEARHAAALHHPGIASIFDYGSVPGGDGSESTRPYLVMELVPGKPLSALLRGGEPMPPDTAADLTAQSADAIAAAHALDIVHRDVKPGNLLVTPDGQVKVTDFGIARAAGGTALTSTGEVIGTPHYLSPEQAEGKPATAASDVYALRVVLYECLAGHRPFAADTPVATALAHLRQPVPPLPDSVPQQLRQVTMTALAKDPADRFDSAADMAAALRGGPLPAGAGAVAADGADETKVMTSAGVPAGAAAAGAAAAVADDEDDGSPGRRRRRLAAYWPVAAAAAAVLLVVALVSLASGGDEPGDTAQDEPTAQTSPEDDRIRVAEDEYVGMEAGSAKEEIEALGLDVSEESLDNPGGNTEGTVASVEPHGLVPPESETTLFVWDDAPAPPPAPEPSSDPGGEEEPDGSGDSGGSGEGSGDEQGSQDQEPSEGNGDSEDNGNGGDQGNGNGNGGDDGPLGDVDESPGQQSRDGSGGPSDSGGGSDSSTGSGGADASRDASQG